MTPSEYSAIRPHLGSSSGFQSWQYREIEFLLGNKNGAMLQPHDERPDLRARLEQAFGEPSLYDEAIRLLARRGFALNAAVLATRPDWAPRLRSFGRSGLARGISLAAAILGPLRARRGTGRPRGRLPALALPSRDDGGTHHWVQAGYRWHRRCCLPAAHVGCRALSRALEGPDRSLISLPAARALQRDAGRLRFRAGRVAATRISLRSERTSR